MCVGLVYRIEIRANIKIYCDTALVYSIEIRVCDRDQSVLQIFIVIQRAYTIKIYLDMGWLQLVGSFK